MLVKVPSYIYTGERNIIQVKQIENTYNYVELVPTGNFAGKPSIRCYKDLDNTAYIDISLYVKDYEFDFRYNVVVNFTFEIRTDTSVLVGTYSIRIFGRLNFQYRDIPQSTFLPDYTTSEIKKGMLLLPPSKLIDAGYLDVFYNSNENTKFRMQEIPGYEFPFNGIFSAYFSYGQSNEFWLGGDNWKAINVLPRDPCEKYVYLIWTSQFGGRRTILFKVKTEGWENDNIQKVITQKPYSNQIFDTKRYIVCYMDDLDAYDYWYYSDILQATDVTMDSSSTGVNGINVRIEGEKKLEYPADDSGEFKTLEFKVWFD